MAEWAGLVHSNAPKYIKGFVDATIRDRIILAMLQKKGHIRYGQGGLSMYWQVQALEPQVSQYSDNSMLDFASIDAYRQANLDWRSLVATDRLTDWQKEINKGPTALIDLSSEIIKRLAQAMRNTFGNQLFVDGNAAGYERSPHGLESFFGTGTTVAADIVAQPSDTYAGLSTAVAQVESTWSANLSTSPNANLATDWPDPSGRVGYDYFSPKIFNWSSTSWGTGGATTWEDNCVRCIRKAHHVTRMSSGKEGAVDMVLLAANLYTGYCNKQESKFRQLTPAPEMMELGFKGVMQEGIEIGMDWDVPANTGYGLNFNEMELLSLKPDLFAAEKPERDPKSDSYLFMVKFFGNLKCNTPKAFFKLKNVA